jgi:hypothetical protein
LGYIGKENVKETLPNIVVPKSNDNDIKEVPIINLANNEDK